MVGFLRRRQEEANSWKRKRQPPDLELHKGCATQFYFCTSISIMRNSSNLFSTHLTVCAGAFVDIECPDKTSHADHRKAWTNGKRQRKPQKSASSVNGIDVAVQISDEHIGCEVSNP